MRKKYQSRFKKGAASFYVVAFSTLILVIIAASFTAIIIAEMTRSSNDDLAKSAYDSALAGVEDAKLAYYNYQRCLEDDAGENCANIKAIMQGEPDCDMVSKILGRVNSNGGEGGEVLVQESDLGNNMQQAYTCVKVDTTLSDYRATLSSENSTKVTRVRFDGADEENIANKIKKVKISWGVDVEASKYVFSNVDVANQKVVFPAAGEDEKSVAVPPTVALTYIQTATQFDMDDFNRVYATGSQENPVYHSDRGTVFLVPTDNAEIAEYRPSSGSERNYIGACLGSGDVNKCHDRGLNNVITMADIAKSNDKTAQNFPFAVFCPRDGGNEFVCSATIELPEPVASGERDGSRNSDTFIFIVSIPYGKPTTDYSLEFFCADGEVCKTASGQAAEEGGDSYQSQAILRNVQIQVDSTGRANDLVRRVETRLEGADDYSSFATMGPLELVGTGEDGETVLLNKNYDVTSEPHSSDYYSSCFEKVFNNNDSAGCGNMPYLSK